MFALINITNGKTEFFVDTLAEAVELCDYFKNLRFSHMG